MMAVSLMPAFVSGGRPALACNQAPVIEEAAK